MKSFKILVRFVTLGSLVLVLLIPLYLIRSTISERASYREEAVQRVIHNTTGAQTFMGPLQVVPWTDTQEVDVTENNVTTRQLRHSTGNLLRTPTTMELGGQLVPSVVRVGLYEVSVYEWRANLKASFSTTALPSPASGVTRVYGAPYLVFRISDVRGLIGTPSLQIDRRPVALASGTLGMAAMFSGVHALLPPVDGAPGAAAPTATMEVAMAFVLRGTHSLAVVPLGNDNHVALESSWPHPKFDGYSPRSEISDAGFKAHWEISALASQVQAKLRGEANLAPDQPFELATATFSDRDNLQVSLVNPVDIYTQADRASKYGILFVVLTFVGFVLFELVKHLQIHPVQYLLVGLALAIFFLLLLSLSEHLPFWLAYVASATACIGLQAVYLSGVLRSWLRAGGFAVMLTALYGVLYSLLASEDNALLMGSLLLFSVLAAIMWITRKLDWYEVAGSLR